MDIDGYKAFAALLWLCRVIKGENRHKGPDNCVTWHDDLRTVTITCKVSNFSQPVTITHENSKTHIDCSIIKPRPFCTPRGKKIEINYDTHRVTVQLVEQKDGKSFFGEWRCSQGENKFVTFVSLSEGIKSDSWVQIRGKIEKYDNKPTYIIAECSSCRKSENGYVEFIVNEISYGSVLLDKKGDCLHKLTNCSPSECNCSSTGNLFSLRIPYSDEVKQVACEMQFKDNFREGRFKKTGRMNIFGGENIFYDTTLTKVIVKNANYIDSKRSKNLPDDKKLDSNGTSEKHQTDIGVVWTISICVCVTVTVSIALVVGIIRNLCKRRNACNEHELHVMKRGTLGSPKNEHEIKYGRYRSCLVTPGPASSRSVCNEPEDRSEEFGLHETSSCSFAVTQGTTNQELSEYWSLNNNSENSGEEFTLPGTSRYGYAVTQGTTNQEVPEHRSLYNNSDNIGERFGLHEKSSCSSAVTQGTTNQELSEYWSLNNNSENSGEGFKFLGTSCNGCAVTQGTTNQGVPEYRSPYNNSENIGEEFTLPGTSRYGYAVTQGTTNQEVPEHRSLYNISENIVTNRIKCTSRVSPVSNNYGYGNNRPGLADEDNSKTWTNSSTLV